jgi:hypothetical protein
MLGFISTASKMHRPQALVQAMVLLPALVAGGQALAADAGALALAASVSAEATEAASGARWSTSYDVSPSNYRWSLARGAIDFGLHFDARPLATRPLDGRVDSAVPLVAATPSLSLGLHSVSAKGDASASSLLERALGVRPGESFERKVGIEWKPAQSRLFLNQGVGIRLDGDDRLTMRLRKGSLGLFMQSNF